MACLPTYRGKRYTNIGELEEALQKQYATQAPRASRASASLPEMESMFDDLAEYARLWKAYNSTKTEEDFYRHVNRDIDKRFNKTFVKAAFNNDITYLEKRKSQLLDTTGPGRTEESQGALKVLADPDIDPAVKAMVMSDDLLYRKKPNEITERDAQYLMEKYGPEKAIPFLTELRRRGNGETAVVLANKIVKQLSIEAKNAPTQARREEIYVIQYDVISDAVAYLRDTARTLQAASMYSKMDFEGFVYNINRLKKKSRADLSRRFKNTLDAIVEEARRASTAAKDKILTDETKARFLRGELTIAQVRNAKERAAEVLRGRGAQGFSVRATPQELKEYGYYTFLGGLINRDSWVNHMMNKGLSRTDAQDMYDNQDFYGRGSLASQSNLPDIKAALGTPDLVNVLKGAPYFVPANEALDIANAMNAEHARRVREHMEKVYRRLLAKKGEKGKLVSAVLKAVESGKYDDNTIADLVAGEFGTTDLTGQQLEELKERFEAAMLEPAGRNRDMAMTEVWAWVYQLNKGYEYGDLFWAFYYANILSSPGTHLLNFVENAIGLSLELSSSAIREVLKGGKGVNSFEVVGTMMRNTVKGLLGVGMRDLGRIVRMGPVAYKGEFKMIENSTLEALAKDENLKWYQVPASKLAKVGKYVGRALNAVDALYYAGFYEMSNVIESARIVREEVKLELLNKDQAKSKFRELVGNKDQFEAALNQAKMEMEEVYRQKGEGWIDELPTGANRLGKTRNQQAYNQWYRTLTRAREIILQERERVASESGSYHAIGALSSLRASLGTYTNPPQGTLGLVARAAASLTQYVPAVRFVLPFVNIVANVYNRQLDYSPWGYTRVWTKTANLLHQKAPENFQWATSGPDAELRVVKATIGTLALVAAYLMFWDEDDEFKEENFAIHGSGPKDPFKRKEMAARGWKPHTIQIGKKFLAFNYSPFALGLSVVANMLDATRYDGLGEKEWTQKFIYGLNRLGSTLMSPSFVKSAADFLGFFEEGKEGSDKFVTAVARIATSSVPVAGSAMVRTIQTTIDDTMRNADDLQQKIERNLPVAKFYLKPDLNAFGEVITSNGAALTKIPKSAAEMTGFNRFVSTSKPDPLYFWMQKNGVTPPQIGFTTQINGVQISRATHYEFVRIGGPIMKQWIERDKKKIEAMPFEEDRQDYINKRIKRSVVADIKYAILLQFNFEPTEDELKEMKIDWSKVEKKVKEFDKERTK